MTADKKPLTPLEKLALSRLALQQSLQPAPAPKSRVGSFFGKFLSRKAGSRNKTAATQTEKANADAVAAAVHTEPVSAASADFAVVLPQSSGSMFSAVLGAGSAAVSALDRYWRDHPAKVAFVIGQPILRGYAKKRPFTLLAVAAATGAVLVLFRPWNRPVARKIASAGISTELSSLGKIGLLCVLLEVWWNRNKTKDDGGAA